MTAAHHVMAPLDSHGAYTTLTDTAAALATRPYARRGVSPRRETIRVVLADDRVIIRRALRSLLQRTVSGIVVAGEASSRSEVVELAVRLQPDVVVLDLDSTNGDGLIVTRELAARVPTARVLVLSTRSEEEQLLPLLRAGARGFLGREAAEQEFVDAIQVVASGDIYVRPVVSRKLATAESERASSHSEATAKFDELSARERTVLQLTAAGFNGPEIGEQLGITAKTVDTYKQRIGDKIGLTHRSEFVRFALDAGVLGR